MNKIMKSFFISAASAIFLTHFLVAAPNEYTVTMTSPEDGAHFESCLAEINFTAELTAPDAVIESVKFYRNGAYLGKDRNGTAPFEAAWKNPYDGMFDIYAELEDTAGVIYTSEKISISIGAAVPGNLVFNGEFNCGKTAPWNLVSWSGAVTNFELDSTFDLSTPPALYVDIVETAPQPAAWNVQVYHPIAVDSGKTYDISFKAEVIEKKDIYLGVQTNDGSNTALWQKMTIEQAGEYSYVYEADQTLHQDAKFLLALGENSTPIALDDIRFVSRSANGVTAQNLFAAGPATSYLLTKNYPNPFNPTTTIQFEISEPAFVTVEVFNLQGQKLKTILEQKISKGQHHVQWAGVNESDMPVPSGLYIYNVRAEMPSNTLVHAQKMLLVK